MFPYFVRPNITKLLNLVAPYSVVRLTAAKAATERMTSTLSNSVRILYWRDKFGPEVEAIIGSAMELMPN